MVAGPCTIFKLNQVQKVIVNCLFTLKLSNLTQSLPDSAIPSKRHFVVPLSLETVPNGTFFNRSFDICLWNNISAFSSIAKAEPRELLLSLSLNRQYPARKSCLKNKYWRMLLTGWVMPRKWMKKRRLQRDVGCSDLRRCRRRDWNGCKKIQRICYDMRVRRSPDDDNLDYRLVCGKTHRPDIPKILFIFGTTILWQASSCRLLITLQTR